MRPKPDSSIGGFELGFLAVTETANNLREVAKVECVMRLRRRWPQVSLNLFVDLESCLHNLLLKTSNVWTKSAFSKVPLQNTSENGVERGLIEIGKGNDIEVPLETRSDEGLATTWRSHRCNNQRVDYGPERMLVILAIVPSITVNELSQDFDWRLGTVFLELRHVQVINIDDASRSKSWAKRVSSSLVELHVHNVLDHVAVSLR